MTLNLDRDPESCLMHAGCEHASRAKTSGNDQAGRDEGQEM